jgi:plasmid maintenance system antidote protein VapI
MPKPVTPVTVAEFIADRLANIDKTQREVAEACGFDQPQIITLFKQGRTKVPFDRVGPLAKALDVDPAHLLRFGPAGIHAGNLEQHRGKSAQHGSNQERA